MKNGFTVIELIDIIVIISILAGIILVNLQGISKDANYYICDVSDDCRIVKEYEEIDKCIKFEDTKICGNYTIKNLKAE